MTKQIYDGGVLVVPITADLKAHFQKAVGRRGMAKVVRTLIQLYLQEKERKDHGSKNEITG